MKSFLRRLKRKGERKKKGREIEIKRARKRGVREREKERTSAPWGSNKIFG